MKKIATVLSNQFYMLKQMWCFSKPLFIGRLVITLINGIVPPINAYLAKVLVDNATKGLWRASLYTILIIAIVQVGNGVLHALLNKKIGLLDDLFKNVLIFDFNSKLVNIDYEILYNPEMIKKKEMAVKVINNQIAIKYLNITLSFISSVISIISIGYILSSISWWVCLILLVLCALKLITVILDKQTSFSTTSKLAPINTEISYYMSMLVDETYANDMRMYSISDWVISKYKLAMHRTHLLLKTLLNKVCITSIIRSFLSVFETVFSYAFVVSQMIFHNMSFSDFSLFLSAFKTFSGAVSQIINGIVELGENSAYMQIYKEFLNTPNNIAIPDKGIDAASLSSVDNIFVFQDVLFRYPNTCTNVLHNVNLKIERNKFYVVVGKNGAGKTTLCRLLCRLYDVSEGCILFNNTDIRDLEYRSFRSLIGIVFQDYKYYCLSIAENVAMNEYVASDEIHEKIYKALVDAGLKEKVDSLPNGIHTQLGKMFDDEGVLLSGGELQKLALARVLFQDPQIVILDEPSSALDAFAEDELIRTFNSALANKTVFYISHRLSVAKYSDKVIYIDNNTVRGFDTHENLIDSIPEYKEMYDAQAKHYQ